jgi:malonate-semialdehyde dehydrogenase (acetylating) / methylmalonate-semialdehyde dehydrogenase
MKDIGLPDGVFNVAQGGFDTVKHMVEHPDIKAISFVGGNRAGEYIHVNGNKVIIFIQFSLIFFIFFLFFLFNFFYFFYFFLP